MESSTTVDDRTSDSAAHQKLTRTSETDTLNATPNSGLEGKLTEFPLVSSNRSITAAEPAKPAPEREPSDDTLAENIRREILNGLASGKKEVGYGQGLLQAKFKIPWNLQAFLKEQYPDEQNLQLGHIITIVGSGVDAQALTCAGYLSQVWPATGLNTLSALQEAVINGVGKPYKCNVFRQHSFNRH